MDSAPNWSPMSDVKRSDSSCPRNENGVSIYSKMFSYGLYC